MSIVILSIQLCGIDQFTVLFPFFAGKDPEMTSAKYEYQLLPLLFIGVMINVPVALSQTTGKLM